MGLPPLRLGPPAASFDDHLFRMIMPGRGGMSGQARFPDSGLSVKLSRTQIDRLGDRLRSAPPSEDDLVLLDEFRRSFGPAYEIVVGRVQELKLAPTGRPAKSTPSVIEKLKRETIRLTQMQDIAGCRVVVPDIVEQDRIADSLVAVFPGTPVTDRRSNPSYGYRAVHLVVQISGIPVEVQVRTLLQHAWAELSEKIADVVDSSIKYGQGPDQIKEVLKVASDAIAEFEALEYNLYGLKLDDKEVELKQKWIEKIEERKKSLAAICDRIKSNLEELKKRDQVVR